MGLTTDLDAAVAALARGEVVAYPTETFYGLAVDVLDPAALARLMALKGRAADKTVGLIVAGRAMVESLCAEIPAAAEPLMARHWPGPLTLCLPARAGLPEALVNDGFVAMRESPHPLAQALVKAFGRPISATSANLAGQPPARSAEEVRAAFPTGCLVLDGGATPGGLPSTLARVRGGAVEILRRGPIDLG